MPVTNIAMFSIQTCYSRAKNGYLGWIAHTEIAIAQTEVTVPCCFSCYFDTIPRNWILHEKKGTKSILTGQGSNSLGLGNVLGAAVLV